MISLMTEWKTSKCNWAQPWHVKISTYLWILNLIKCKSIFSTVNTCFEYPLDLLYFCNISSFLGLFHKETIHGSGVLGVPCQKPSAVSRSGSEIWSCRVILQLRLSSHLKTDTPLLNRKGVWFIEWIETCSVPKPTIFIVFHLCRLW